MVWEAVVLLAGVTTVLGTEVGVIEVKYIAGSGCCIVMVGSHRVKIEFEWRA
jgi:hypothetical protein